MESLKAGIQVVNEEFFKLNMFDIKKKEPDFVFKNPHHDLAMLRYVFETQNVQDYAGYTLKGIMRRRVVDVGGSTRLALSGLAGVALWPHIGYQDTFREDRRLAVIDNLKECYYPDRFTVERKTFQEYMQGSPDLDALYVFTDTLYYINPNDLELLTQHSNIRGVLGVGNMHVFKASGLIYINDNVYGSVFIKNQKIFMKVKGNENVYEHANYYSELAYSDEMAIKTLTGYIVITVSKRVPLGATDYIKFTITYTDQLTINTISKQDHKYAMIDNRCNIVEAFTDAQGLVLPKNMNVISTRNGGFILRRTIKGKIDATVIPVNERSLFSWESYHSVVVEQQNYDFEVAESVVTSLVAALVTQKSIDVDEIKCSIKKTMKISDADPELYVIPIVIEALTVVLNIEASVDKIARSELVNNINVLKSGGVQVGIFGRLLEAVFGVNNNSSGKSLNPDNEVKEGYLKRKVKNTFGHKYQNNKHGLLRSEPTISSKQHKMTLRTRGTTLTLDNSNKAEDFGYTRLELTGSIDIGKKMNTSLTNQSLSAIHNYELECAKTNGITGFIKKIFNKNPSIKTKKICKSLKPVIKVQDTLVVNPYLPPKKKSAKEEKSIELTTISEVDRRKLRNFHCKFCKLGASSCKCSVGAPSYNIDLENMSAINLILKDECNETLKLKEDKEIKVEKPDTVTLYSCTSHIPKNEEHKQYVEMKSFDNFTTEVINEEVPLESHNAMDDVRILNGPDLNVYKIVETKDDIEVVTINVECEICKEHQHHYDKICECPCCIEICEKHATDENGNYSDDMFAEWLMYIQDHCNVGRIENTGCECHFCQHPSHYYKGNEDRNYVGYDDDDQDYVVRPEDLNGSF